MFVYRAIRFGTTDSISRYESMIIMIGIIEAVTMTMTMTLLYSIITYIIIKNV